MTKTERRIESRWRSVTLPTTGSPPLLMASPFRPVDVAALPPGTQFAPLDEPICIARAAIKDLLVAVSRDITSARRSNAPIRQTADLIDLYRCVSVLGDGELCAGDLRAGVAVPNELNSLADGAAELVAALAASPKGVRTLTLHLVVQFLDARPGVKAGHPSPTLLQGMVDHQRRRVTAALVKDLHRLGESRGWYPGNGHLMPIIRPAHQPEPLLAFIPRGRHVPVSAMSAPAVA